MAFDSNEIGAEHLTVKAGEDLRAYQGMACKITAVGVLRSTAAATSGHTFTLMNKPNSGESATLYGPPNVAKSVAGAAVGIGQYITDTGSAYFIVGSYGNCFGISHDTVSSGSVFALRFI